MNGHVWQMTKLIAVGFPPFPTGLSTNGIGSGFAPVYRHRLVNVQHLNRTKDVMTSSDQLTFVVPLEMVSPGGLAAKHAEIPGLRGKLAVASVNWHNYQTLRLQFFFLAGMRIMKVRRRMLHVFCLFAVAAGQTVTADEPVAAPGLQLEPIEFIENAPPAGNQATARLNADVPAGWGTAVFSPDSKSVATVSVADSADPKGELMLWNVDDTKVLMRYEQMGRIAAIAFSPDGRWLALGPVAPQAGVKLLDTTTGQVGKVLPGAVSRTNVIAWSRDGSRLALGSSIDRSIRVWNVSDGKFLKTYEPDVRSFFTLEFTTSDRLLAAGLPLRENDALLAFDVMADKDSKLFKGIKESIEGCRFSADGTRLISVGWDATIRLWDVEKGEEAGSIKGHKKGIRSIAGSADGKLLATAGDRELKIWDAEKKELLSDLGPENTGAKFLAMSPDGAWLVTIARDGSARLWDVAKKSEKATLNRNATATGSSSGGDAANSDSAAAKPVNDAPEAEAIQSLAYSPDGLWIAIAREDGRISIRHAADGKVARELEAFTDVAACVTFSPDSQRLAAGSFDKSVKVWNVISGEQIAELNGHSNWVFSVAFSADGNTLATASYDKSIKLWNIPEAKEIGTLLGHTAGVRSVVFSRDGKYLVSGSADRTAIIWNLADHNPIATLKGHAAAIRAVACSPDGLTVATASEDATVKLWKTADWTERASIQGTEGVMFWCVAYSPAGRSLAAGAFDGTVKLYDPTDGKERKTLRGATEAITAVAFAPGAREVIAGSIDKTLRRWKSESATKSGGSKPEKAPELKSSEALTALKPVVLNVEKAVLSLSFNKDGKLLVVGTGQLKSPGSLQVWNLASHEKLWQGDDVKYGLPAVTFSRDEQRIAVGNYFDRFWRLVDATSGKQIKEVRGHRGNVTSIAYSPNGQLIATASLDRDVKLWDATTYKEVKTMVGHTDYVSSIVFSPDGKRLLSGSYDGTARLWDVDSGKQISEMKGYRGLVMQACYSHDGKLIAAAGRDGTGGDAMVRIYDAANGDFWFSLRGHRTRVESVAFSPNGKLIATGGSDKTIRLWDVASGAELLKLSQDGAVRAVLFAPDNRHLATGCDDKTVKLWDLSGFRASEATLTDSKQP